MRVKSCNRFAALFAVVGGAGLAVPVVASPPPPTIPLVVPSDSAAQTATFARSFSIEVVYKQQKVWAGTLRTSRGASANYSQQMSQSAEPCPGDQSNARSFGNVSESLRVSVNSISPYERGAARLAVQFERPKMVCGAMGSDTISIQRSIDLDSGKSVTIEGEDGLTVRITRT